MTNLDPSWGLTDEALVLILHAENGAAGEVSAPLSRTRLGQLGGTMSEELGRREVAVLRLVSAVEAYTDAASNLYFTKKFLEPPRSPFSWPARRKYYQKQHSIELEVCDGWGQVDAGIDLRNCLAHGLGNLTELLISDQFLGKRMADIDVTVGGNRMHTTAETVPKLASGCRRFVLDIETELVARL